VIGRLRSRLADRSMRTPLPSCAALLPERGDSPFRFQNDTQDDTILKED